MLRKLRLITVVLQWFFLEDSHLRDRFMMTCEEMLKLSLTYLAVSKVILVYF